MNFEEFLNEGVGHTTKLTPSLVRGAYHVAAAMKKHDKHTSSTTVFGANGKKDSDGSNQLAYKHTHKTGTTTVTHTHVGTSSGQLHIHTTGDKAEHDKIVSHLTKHLQAKPTK